MVVEEIIKMKLPFPLTIREAIAEALLSNSPAFTNLLDSCPQNSTPLPPPTSEPDSTTPLKRRASPWKIPPPDTVEENEAHVASAVADLALSSGARELEAGLLPTSELKWVDSDAWPLPWPKQKPFSQYCHLYREDAGVQTAPSLLAAAHREKYATSGVQTDYDGAVTVDRSDGEEEKEDEGDTPKEPSGWWGTLQYIGEVCSSLCSPTLMMDLDEDAPPSPAHLPDDTQVPDPTLPEHEASVELLTNVSPSILQLLHQDSEDENPPS